MPGDDGEALRAVPGTGLGFLRHDRQGSESFAALPADIRAKAREPHRLVLAQGNSRSTVYRSKYLDYVSVKKLGRDGRVIGEWRFLGLYTHSAYTESIARIPVLRRKLTDVLTAAGVTPDSHDGNDLIEILENYPREELFQISDQPADRDRARPCCACASASRPGCSCAGTPTGVTCRAWCTCRGTATRPRSGCASRRSCARRWTAPPSTTARWSGSRRWPGCTSSCAAMRGRPLPDVDAAALERRIAAAVRTWDEDLEEEALRTLGQQRAGLILDQFAAAIPETYKTDVTAADAVGDLGRILQLRESGELVRGPAARRRPPRPAASGGCACTGRGPPSSCPTCCPSCSTWALEVVDEHPYEFAARPARSRSGSTTSGCAPRRRPGSSALAAKARRSSSSRRCARCGGTRSRTTASTRWSSTRG